MSLLDSRAIRDWVKQKFLSVDNVLKTKETVEANTEEGKSVDALVVKEVFQSVSDGKSLVASAITDKGVQTDATATFQEMATNIGLISGGGGSDFPVSSPYTFEIKFQGFPYNSGDYGIITCNLPFNNLKRLVIKKVYFTLRKDSTSNSSGYFYFGIRGKKNGNSGVYAVQYSGSLVSSQTYQVIVDNNSDYEVDISEFESIDEFYFNHTYRSGTVVSGNLNVTLVAELYFD